MAEPIKTCGGLLNYLQTVEYDPDDFSDRMLEWLDNFELLSPVGMQWIRYRPDGEPIYHWHKSLPDGSDAYISYPIEGFPNG